MYAPIGVPHDVVGNTCFREYLHGIHHERAPSYHECGAVQGTDLTLTV
jgi:hypothetical protein